MVRPGRVGVNRGRTGAVPGATAMSSRGDVSKIEPSFFRKAQQAGVQELMGHYKKVHTVAWNANGTRLASGGGDRTVCLWHVESSSGSLENELKGHSNTVERASPGCCYLPCLLP